MIWWGYAGFSGAIVLSMALLATIMGVSTENILALIAQSGLVLLTVGICVNLCVIALQARPKQRTTPRPTTPAVLRQPIVVAAPAKSPLAAKLAPVPTPASKTVPQQQRYPRIAALWPTQAAQ